METYFKEIVAYQAPSTGRVIPLMRWRRDADTAQMLEFALGIQQYCGTYLSALSLYAKGIPIDVALRVLLQPEQRRSGQRRDAASAGH